MKTHEQQVTTEFVTIEGDTAELEGVLGVPNDARGIVLFAHGSGSSRHSPRNNYVAQALQQCGLATLLFDLLTEREGADRSHVFDINLLARRLMEATRFVHESSETKDLAVSYFGASTGAGAAIEAAALSHIPIKAIVSRGGRPDLACSFLRRVTTPTLLIVGENDHDVLRLNQMAFESLRCERELSIVPGAGHLFEEPDALNHVIMLAGNWYGEHLI